MKFKFEIKDLVKLPNILCYIRIIMVPLFLYLYFTADEPGDYYIATLIVMLSGITDFLDGQIARRCNMITDLGKVIDPVADKLMQLAMLAALTVNVRYMCVLTGYLIVKEVVMACIGFCILRKTGKRLNGAKWKGMHSSIICMYAGACGFSSYVTEFSGYYYDYMCGSSHTCICYVYKIVYSYAAGL